MRLAVSDHFLVTRHAELGEHRFELGARAHALLAIGVHRERPVEVDRARDVTAARGAHVAAAVLLGRARIEQHDVGAPEPRENVILVRTRRGADDDRIVARRRLHGARLERVAVRGPRRRAAAEQGGRRVADHVQRPDETRRASAALVVVGDDVIVRGDAERGEHGGDLRLVGQQPARLVALAHQTRVVEMHRTRQMPGGVGLGLAHVDDDEPGAAEQRHQALGLDDVGQIHAGAPLARRPRAYSAEMLTSVRPVTLPSV